VCGGARCGGAVPQLCGRLGGHVRWQRPAQPANWTTTSAMAFEPRPERLRRLGNGEWELIPPEQSTARRIIVIRPTSSQPHGDPGSQLVPALGRLHDQGKRSWTFGRIDEPGSHPQCDRRRGPAFWMIWRVVRRQTRPTSNAPLFALRRMRPTGRCCGEGRHHEHRNSEPSRFRTYSGTVGRVCSRGPTA